jgi:chorismate mutase
MAELRIKQACIFEKNKDWTEVSQCWEDAYQLLNEYYIDIDAWKAILIDHEEHLLHSSHRRHLPLPDGHDIHQLQQLYDVLDTVNEHTEQKREEALNRVQHELDKIARRLQPMFDDRDAVRAQIGEHKWSNNPAPKRDYERERAELIAYREALNLVIVRLEALSLLALQ